MADNNKDEKPPEKPEEQSTKPAAPIFPYLSKPSTRAEDDTVIDIKANLREGGSVDTDQ